METHTCKNCGNLFQGNYCNNCGQPAHTHPINTNFVMHDIRHGLFHIDGGLLYSAQQLFLRPGHTIREYIDGKRAKHYKPFSMVIVLASFYGLLYHLLEIDLFRTVQDDSFNHEQLNGWMAHYYAFITLALIPVFSLSSYLMFRRSGYNFVEHMVLNSFYSCQKLVVRMVLLPLFLVVPNQHFHALLNSFLLLDLLLMCWTYSQFFRSGSHFSIFVRTILSYLIALLLSGILIAVILVALASMKLL